MKNKIFLPAAFLLFCASLQAQNHFPEPSGLVTIDCFFPDAILPSANLTIGDNGPNNIATPTVKLRINEHNPFIELNDNSTSGGPMVMAQCGIRLSTSASNTYELKSFSNTMMGRQGVGLFNNAQNFGLAIYGNNGTKKIFLGMAGTDGASLFTNFGDVNITSSASAPSLTIHGGVYSQPVLESGYSFGVLGNSLFSGKVVIGGRVSDFPSLFPGTYKLYVKDGILAERVKVALVSSSFWADYVFDKEYKLMPLKDVHAYIVKNKHLPGVPSADEVFEQGIDVATMDATLLKKIEEMTLYIIQMENRIKELENQAKKSN